MCKSYTCKIYFHLSVKSLYRDSGAFSVDVLCCFSGVKVGQNCLEPIKLYFYSECI